MAPEYFHEVSEHGLSQVVDWHFRIDDYRRTSKLQEHFGSDDIAFQGVLIIGRDHFLQEQGTRRRVEKTTIDSRSVHCFTFDKLYREMAGRLENLKLVGSGSII
nr:Shedu anti-phage system protein SduA domain-containing protein [uncultured Rhodopila sp.]